MTDRVYLRANFTSATTPASGGKLKNPFGHEYASLPLQLPSNLVDVTRIPKAVEMMLTKLNIPLGSLPIAQIPLNRIVRTSPSNVTVESKGIITIWPFMITASGLLSGGYQNFPFQGSITDWPVAPAKFPLQSLLSSRKAAALKLNAVEQSRILDFYNIEDVMEFLTMNINNVYSTLFAESGIVDMEFRFEEKDSRLTIHAVNFGASPMKAPFSLQFTNANNERPYPTKGQIVSWATDANGAIARTGDPETVGFSIVVNQAIRDMFPRLPWREVNNDDLEPVDSGTLAGTQIPNWKETNWGDPIFYVLDTMACDSSYVDNGITRDADIAILTPIRHLRGIDYTFSGCNLISMVPIQAFVVMLSGVSITQQAYPVNVSPSTMSSALTTSIPIVEVYYPLWDKISDLSTNIVITKDAFTNAAPFVLDQNALRSRDIKFTVYYITNDSKMHELTIPPGTSLSLQACYSITY